MFDFSATLEALLAIDPGANAIDHEGRWSTWGELATTIHALQNALDGLGCHEDARLGILLRNRPPQVAALLGAIASNRCVVTLNPLFPDDRLADDIARLSLPVVIGQAADLERAGVAPALDAAGCAVIALPDRLGQGVDIKAPLSGKPGIRHTEPGVIIEMLTSGTTGAPKRVPLKRTSFQTSFAAALGYERGRRSDETPRLRKGTVLVSAPLAHIGGVWHTVNTFMSGRKGCMLEKFRVDDWQRAVLRHRPTVANCPPSALRMLLDADLSKDVFSSLRAIRSGTAPLDPAIVDQFMERYDLPILQNYGATEFAGAVAGWTLESFRARYRDKEGSVGQLNAGIDGRIVDADTGQALPFGEEGVLELRGGQLGSGSEWIRTTDRAVLDEDRYLWIRGRADHAIIRGGFKVHADDVVTALHGHPAIREAAVVGIEDRRLGQAPAAALILKDDQPAPSDEELASFLRERLLPYQVPVRFLFVEDFPRTPSMKPALVALQGLFESR